MLAISPRIFGCTAAMVLFVVATPRETSSAHWWHSPDIVARLGLSVEQRQAIDRVYGRTLSKRTAATARANEVNAKLEVLLLVDGTNEEEVERAAAVAAEADAMRGRLRTLMLYRILRILTPDQRARLSGLLDLKDPDDL
jgi:Spy/CpxP family protein refolding chaperone